MNKELKGLVIEICAIVLLVLVVVPICVSASSVYRQRMDMALIADKASVDISNKGEYKIVKIKSGVDKKVKMNLMMKISKFNDSYLIYLDDQEFNLNDLEYSEDENNQYYNLGVYEVEKSKKIQFKIKVKDKAYYDETITYSFYTEGIM